MNPVDDYPAVLESLESVVLGFGHKHFGMTDYTVLLAHETVAVCFHALKRNVAKGAEAVRIGWQGV